MCIESSTQAFISVFFKFVLLVEKKNYCCCCCCGFFFTVQVIFFFVCSQFFFFDDKHFLLRIRKTLQLIFNIKTSHYNLFPHLLFFWVHSLEVHKFRIRWKIKKKHHFDLPIIIVVSVFCVNYQKKCWTEIKSVFQYTAQ